MKLVLLWCNLQYITLFEFPEKKLQVKFRCSQFHFLS